MLTMILRILKISGKNKPRILLGIFFNILKTFSMALMIFAILLILNNLHTLNSKVILHALWITLGSISGRFLFQWLMDITMSAKGFDMFRDYRLNIGDRLKKAPMGYFSEQRLGTIQTVLTSTVVELEQYSMLAITDITGGIFMALIITILFLFYSPLFSLLTLAGLGIGMWVLHIIQRRGVEHTPLVQAAQENLTTQSLEYIRGIAVMRAFSVSENKEEAVYEAFERKMQADLYQEHAVAGLLKWYAAVYKITGALLMLSSSALYLAGSITLPYCLMFIICAFLVYAEMEQMGDGAFLAKKITTELNRLENVTNMPVMDTSGKVLNLKRFDIELKDVSFGYDSRTIIDHVSLKVPQGTTCAIVGPSGSGKTTLCNLIARFWDVKEGEVLIGGYQIRDYTADSLLKYISMVFQNVYLFHDTIENNIRFGNPDATKKQLMEAAKRARCHDFIMGLPDGYQTVVGESGSTLSGGEKQRISIARAILKDAPIIILDEATSSVDPENEHELLGAIKELTKGKTLISIAHRLTTVRDADQILVIDSGSVAQHGTHEQLIKEEGIYSRFWKQRRSASGWKL
ncbi:ABC transporter ATP-binding protein [Clostridium boliviensis]|uniref:ABC transporter ATP-binding protein n=1 Tax=Clostridium boliviensis TaxID=318465 RepID=A0ABU4GT90_9CLOT|nr:ABC transporter ATP-binding protein [Clostridium boliviensis]MDW2800849.1 ABC transporter ATP-binding protein [Clostridium boliviensis]